MVFLSRRLLSLSTLIVPLAILSLCFLALIADLGLNVRVSVAGGINQSTVQDVVRAGADIIVVGAAIYGAASPAEAAREIRELVDAA